MDEMKKVVPKAPPKAAPKAPPKNPDDVPPRNLQDALDEMKRRKEEKAPTTKTEMGKLFKKGGYVKAADGCAKRGKTRGRMM